MRYGVTGYIVLSSTYLYFVPDTAPMLPVE